MQLLFHRRLPRRRREGPFRTRVFCTHVDPSIRVRHRDTTIKQYWKCDRALRTETTINEPRDLGVGKLLANLVTLRRLGRDINRRLLDLERQAHHCTPAASTFEALIMPTGDPDHRAPGLHFGDPRVVGLLAALSEFRWVCDPIRNRTLRPLVEHYLARPYMPGEMAYDLRRLCRKQILERLPHSHSYRLTPTGRQLALFTTKLYERALCPGLGRTWITPGSMSCQRSPRISPWRKPGQRYT